MFFRRPKERKLTFAEQLERLRAGGYDVRAAGGRTLVCRDHLAAVLAEEAGGGARILDTGLLLGEEVALLTDVGYQKIFLTPGGRRAPALAGHLQALHDLQQDLIELLGLQSLYNESLGTVNAKHLYDRVSGRDAGVAPRPWQRS